MAHIFISYSRKDQETTNQIVARLKERGFPVWIDHEGIKGGKLWRVEIVEAIDNADAFVLMLSPNSAASDNVRKEVDLAESSNRKIFPVLLAPVALPPQLRYQLAGIQWIDYFSNPEEKFNELVNVLIPAMSDKFLRRVDGDAKRAKLVEDEKIAEVVIGGLNLSNFGVQEQEKLLTFIAEITSTPRADISYTNLTAGSVHAFIKMPMHSAYLLKTAALNRDKRMLKYGIDAIRLNGEQKYALVRKGQFASVRARRRPSILNRLLSGIIIFAIAVATGLSLLRAFPLFFPSLQPTPTATPTLTFTPTLVSTATPSPIPTPTLTPTITSTPAPQILYNFILEAVFALWNSCEGRGCEFSATGTPVDFGFPGSQKNGFAVYGSEYLEDGQAYKNFLYTHPKETATGAIRGFYDANSVTIQQGDRFVAKLGFLLDANSADGVIYRLYFWQGDTPPHDPSRQVYDPLLISEYVRLYRGKLDQWTVLLPDNIVNQSGWFILEVDAGRSPENDLAVWVDARIERP
jgi:hypothetical protein